MVKINPASGSNNEFSINQTQSEKSPKDIVIFNFDDQNPVGNKKQPYEVKFDKDGYPIPDGETLQLTPQEKHSYLWGLITYETGGEYTYIANGKENIAEIKDKFHLNKGAIHNSNRYIRDDGWTPEKGRKIYFMRGDIDTQRK